MIWHKSGLVWPWMTFEVLFHLTKMLRLHNVDIIEKSEKYWKLNKNISQKKIILKF